MISFNSIPATLRVPGQYIEFDASRAVSGLPAIANRVLLVGQQLAAGSADALDPQVIAQADQAVALFGRGSMLAQMAYAFKRADQVSEVHAIGLDDLGGGTAATGTIDVTGPSSAAGTIALMIAGQRVPVTLASGTSAADAATAIAAAINAAPDLPVTAAAVDDAVTLTARHKGICGNEIDLRHSQYRGEALPTGIGIAITAMADGAGNPDYSTIWDAIGDSPYRTIVIGTADAAIVAAMKAELDDRWGPIRMLESVCYAAKPGSQGTLAAFGDTLNSELVSVFGTGASATPPWEAAALYGARVGYYSAIDPARPFHTLTLPGMVGPRETEQFTRAERELLLADGIATYIVGQDGTCRIERAITTYQTNAFGLDDVAYLDLNSVLTLGYLRVAVRARIAAKYPRHKLASDGTNFGPGQAIVTPNVLRAELVALAREWEEAGLVENLDQFVGDLIVERDSADPNRVNALVPPDLVNQFRSFAAAIQFRL